MKFKPLVCIMRDRLRNHSHRLQRTARNVVTVFQVAHGKAHPRSGDLIWINTPNLSLYCVYVDCGLQRRCRRSRGNKGT